MYQFEEKVRKVEIELPKGKILIVLPEGVPADYPEIKRIEKQQREVELGTGNGIPSTVILSSISGDLTQGFSTTDEFRLYFNLISGIVVLRAKRLLATTRNRDGILVDTKVVSKTVVPLKNFFLVRFNVLALNPNSPDNGQMGLNELWISDPVVSSNTRNVDDITVLGHKGVSLVSPEEGFVLFTAVFQNGMLVRKNVSTFMIASTKRISDYLYNTIDIPLS